LPNLIGKEREKMLKFRSDGLRILNLPIPVISFVAVFFYVLFLSGCAGPQSTQDTGPLFFPPPPNPPRVQYLTSISTSRDLEVHKRSSLSIIVIGDVEAERTKPIIKPYGITVFGNTIYVCDTIATRVAVIDLEKKDFEFLKGDYGFGKLKKPISLALDSEKNLYVTDTVRREIVVYGPSGNFLRAFGKEYDMKPVDVAVDGDLLYVLDIKNHEVKILDRKTGKLIDSLGKGLGPEDSLSLPIGLALGPKGSLYVTNITTGKVINLDRDGHVLGSFGKLGDGFGEFGRPKGIAVDSKNRIFVVDASHQNVQMFNSKGQLLMFFGDPGLPMGSMNLPAGVAVVDGMLDYFQKYVDTSFEVEELIFVTNQFGNAKIAVYALGNPKNR
jgi:sugar lactone lactonase YvrE